MKTNSTLNNQLRVAADLLAESGFKETADLLNQKANGNLSFSQENYLRERAKYANVKIEEGAQYRAGGNAIYTIVEVNNKTEKVALQNQSGHTITKTLHWCRKKLNRLA